MEKEKYIGDIKEIKDIMNRSSRFASLSGLSGVLVGIYAVIAAFFSYRTVFGSIDSLGWERIILNPTRSTNLLVIASFTLVLSIGTVIFLNNKTNEKGGTTSLGLSYQTIAFSPGYPLNSRGSNLSFLSLQRIYFTPGSIHPGLLWIGAGKCQ